MDSLIDTNIIIAREGNMVLDKNVQELSQLLAQCYCGLLVHPLSIREIEKDKDTERKKVTLSKVKCYNELKSPPQINLDNFFQVSIGVKKDSNSHDIIDASLLFAVYQNAVNWLITEDLGLHAKAKKVNLSDRVLTINEAIDALKKLLPAHKSFYSPPSIKEEFLYNLNLSDPFFDSLRKDYDTEIFNDWFKKKQVQKKKAFVHKNASGGLDAFLMLKEEPASETITAEPPLEKKKRIKIATLKVEDTGKKMGELFLKLAFQATIKWGVDEIYVTHFVEETDSLVRLLEKFGFVQVENKVRHPHRKDLEKIFIKNTKPTKEKVSRKEITDLYYPSFYDGLDSNKFLVPIQPQFHERLFIEYKGRQPKLFEYNGEFITEGNTILKAYICNSSTKKIVIGDLLLFYRSGDTQTITSIGIVDKILYEQTDIQSIINATAKRTVYTKKEIEEFSKPALVILFKWHFDLPKSVDYNTLLKSKIISGPIQQITQVGEEEYKKIKVLSGIDSSYTVQ